MINRTHIEHTVAAIAIQSLIALTGLADWWASGAIACAVFLGREIAQHEYKHATNNGWSWGKPLPIKGHEGIIYGWSRDSVLDVAIPVAVCSLIAVCLS